MPTYEYLCKNCGERLEKVQSFKARPLKTHDVCGGAVQKVFHASGVVFKGPGFYATDSRPSNGSTSGDSTTNAASTTSDSTSKADSKSSSNGSSTKPKKTESSTAAAKPSTD